MDSKTKDVLKQLQADVRHLQSLVADSRDERKADSDVPGEVLSAASKGKADAVVQYVINRPASGSADAAIKTGMVVVTDAQIAKVTDENAAILGYALSSPQKIALLRALLSQESENAAALGKAANLSTGSLYHHLRDLMHAGLIAQAGRNQYQLTPRGQRVLLVLLALASES